MTPESKEALVEEFRRESILAAAMRVIARRGPQAATMQSIADEAGVAKGTIYLYYQDRTELMERAAAFAVTGLLKELEAEALVDRPLSEQLRALLRIQIAFFDKHQEFLRVSMSMRNPESDCATSARRGKGNRPEYRRYQELLARLLERAMERGEARKMDASRVALFLAEGLSALLLRRLTDPGPAAEKDVEWIADLVLAGISNERRKR